MKGRRVSKNRENTSFLYRYKRILIVLIELILVILALNLAKNFTKDTDKIKVLINSNDVILKYDAFIENRKSIFIYGRY